MKPCSICDKPTPKYIVRSDKLFPACTKCFTYHMLWRYPKGIPPKLLSPEYKVFLKKFNYLIE